MLGYYIMILIFVLIDGWWFCIIVTIQVRKEDLLLKMVETVREAVEIDCVLKV